jgi:2-keto-3-deoxy-L-rhamnonate aldolase RhmA
MRHFLDQLRHVAENVEFEQVSEAGIMSGLGSQTRSKARHKGAAREWGMAMRKNPVKSDLRAGSHVFGTMVFEFFTPGMPQIVKTAGAEFILFDMEHSGVTIETLKGKIAACRGIGLVPMVRVPTLQYHFIARCLDMGAMGIMVPMVETAAQAREIVSATRYPPAGRRGAAFAMAHDDYEAGSVPDKMAAANERTLVIALVETAAGVAAVDEIAAVDGIDVVWMGHFDLTNFMGIPGQFEHPDYLRAVDNIVQAAKRHDKVAGMMAADEGWARDYLAKGFRIIAYGVDHLLFQRALADGLSHVREMVK